MNRQIAIFDEEYDWMSIFQAPADKYAARQLWVFLVDNLRPGFIVELSTLADDGQPAAELTRLSGHKVTPELYASLME